MSKRVSLLAAVALLMGATEASAGGISGSFAGVVSKSEPGFYGVGDLTGQPVTGTFATQFTACEPILYSGLECYVPQLSMIFDIGVYHYDFSRAYAFPSSFQITDTAAGEALTLSPDNGDPHGTVALTLRGPANAFTDNGDPATLHGGPVFASASTAVILSRTTIAYIQLTSVQVDGVPVAGVPEPSAWAFLIAGFGLTGLGLRTRRRLV